MPPDLLLVEPGDVILTAGTEPSAIEDPMTPGPLPAGLTEKTDETTTLGFGHARFNLRTRWTDCYAVLRSLYCVHGNKGVARLFEQNSFVVETLAGGPDGLVYDPDTPANPRRDLYRLMSAARDVVLKQSGAVLGQVQTEALRIGLAQLEHARGAVERETVRYFSSVNDADDARRVLASDVAGWGYLLDENAPGTRGLRAALARLQPFVASARDAEARYVAARDAIGWISAGLAQHNQSLVDDPAAHAEVAEELRAGLQKKQAELPGLERLAKDTRAALVAQVRIGAAEYPVLWRIYTTTNADDRVALGREMLAELRSAWQGNRELRSRLKDDPALVWSFPPLPRRALATQQLGSYTLPGSTAEIRIDAEGGARPAGAVAGAVGLTHLGLIGIAALAGAGPVAAPLALGLFAVEAVASIIDAVQEYREFRLKSAAFEATLDPAEALCLEPSAVGTLFVIGFDFLALIPPARAARAVP